MRLFTFTLLLMLSGAERAFAHAGHGDEPFAKIFEQLSQAAFHIREIESSAPNSYVTFPDGTRFEMDSRFQMAARRIAGDVAVETETDALYTTPTWREYRKAYAGEMLAKLDYFFSRRFAIDLYGTMVDSYSRFGLAFATVIGAAELIDHSPLNPTAIPFCKVIYGAGALCAREVLEAGLVLTKPYPGPMTLDQRVSTWIASKINRIQMWRTLRTVKRISDDADLNQLARRRSFRDFSPGAETLYGGVLRPGFFRHALTDPVCEDCDLGHGGLRYGANTTVKKKGFTFEGRVPVIEDFGDHMPRFERGYRTNEYIRFVEMIFEHAQLAAGDLGRVKDGVGPDARRVPLAETRLKMRGFHQLRFELAQMRRTMDRYSYALRMRAQRESARTSDELAIDRDFAENMGEFVRAYIAHLKAVDAMDPRREHDAESLRVAPRRALTNVRSWLKTGTFCEKDLVDRTETEPDADLSALDALFG